MTPEVMTPEISISLHNLDAFKGMMQDAQEQLAELMYNCSYFDAVTFNKAGKTRNILDNTLIRIAEATKRLRQLEFVDKHDMLVDEYLAEKKTLMNECSDLQYTVDKQWAVVQDMCVPKEPVEGDYAITPEDQGIES
jgi:hypothetical protein